MWALSLTGLAPSSLISVPAGATLELRNVTLVLSRIDLTSLFTGLCRDTGAWPHSPGVTMDDGTIAIRELDTTAPGPNGLALGGGVVRWRDVLITCTDTITANAPPRPGLWKPYPCAARPVVGSGGGGAEELRRASPALLGATQGPVFLSLTSNISLATGFGYWGVLTRGSAGRLVLRGSPGAATTLDLAGREDAWAWAPPPSSPDSTYARLYDMTLVNLPYSTHPSGPADLMALAALCFGVRPPPGAGGAGVSTGPRLRLTRCTLVLPDEEVAFLRGRAEAASEAGAATAWAGSPVTGIPPSLASVNASSFFNLSMRVLLLNCTLLSASAYAALPGAVPLLPQSRVWPPLLLHGNRTRALAQGPSGLAVAPGLEAALASQERVCGQAPGGAAVTLVARRRDDTVSPVGQGPEGGITVGGAEAAGPGAGLGSPGSSAASDVCTVSGYAPELVGGRTFTDLKVVAGRCVLARPLRLRNLVLYNLAPGGSGSPLEGGDAAWANSSLPLWYFSLVRSASPGDPAPLLLLDNVTLVVPEPEWRALAAAPLSLDPGSGVLVLASARHYGWYGTHVTVTYTLPPDAPPGASLLPYPELRLPYQELADADTWAQLDFTTLPVYFCELRDRLKRGADEDGDSEAAAVVEGDPLAEKSGLQAAIRALQAELGGDSSEMEVFSVLGSGAFGVVYTGRWRSLPVAVKTMVVTDVESGNEGRRRQQAVLEAAISLSMAHENLVATYTYMLKPLVQQPSDTSCAGGQGVGPGQQMPPGTVADGGADAYKLYIVQELCNGGSLQQALSHGMAGSVRNGGSSRLLALRLALDVARGVAHVHACRIVHGDLKPDNVLLMVSPEGGGETGNHGSAFPALTAKVADFGLSLPLPEDATHQSKRYQGTPCRMAPEVARRGELSQRSDVWSFGTMLIEFFFGCTLEGIAAAFMSTLPDVASKMEYQQLCNLLLEDMLSTSECVYALLAASCFAPNPHNRPTFKTIVSRLEAILGSS
ncbi:hypothetical protein GPECTOR_38g361 [Gonium pectorale]|uniref:Protein kinase domain-containing protein n=1 Tax=Gonium pectorale TaxID=33097 RepID=A0A150GBH9_GONPE|nr:hypothetical protein GPECTOR_38g361 [Gonium pectorale]|eukprot:KXZ47123.1 hypothetical protein GPECTOR_38g361 [Gonium pectorale]